jgi:hypothetical protein
VELQLILQEGWRFQSINSTEEYFNAYRREALACDPGASLTRPPDPIEVRGRPPAETLPRSRAGRGRGCRAVSGGAAEHDRADPKGRGQKFLITKMYYAENS